MPAPSIAGLVAVGVLRRFSFGGCEDAALRTQHSFTLGARLAELTTVVDCWKTSLKHGTAPPASLFDEATDPEPTDVAGIVAATAMEEPEEEEEEELAEAAVEQAVAASVVDTLALVDLKDCTACTPVCGEHFSHLNMTTKAKGYKNQWVCTDREACLVRQQSGAGMRARQAPRR